MKQPTFTNAQMMAQNNPDTFEAPTAEELASLVIGDFVKVCAANIERFWVIITAIDGDDVIGTINNDLVCSRIHGLKCGDTIHFSKANIYSIYEEV